MDYKTVDYSKLLYTTNYNKNFIKISYESVDNKLIIKTPKFKIGHSAKKFETSKRVNYAYSLNIENDTEFSKFIYDCEKQILNQINILKEKNELNILDFEYKSSLYKSYNNELFFKIKLLTDKNNEIITQINNINRKVETIDSINTNFYSNQYIELSCIYITMSGEIYSLWYAHQIVLSPIDKIYNLKSLIDELAENEPIVPTYRKMPLSVEPPSLDIPPQAQIHSKPQAQKPPVPKMPVLKLDPNMLTAMRAKLKKS